MWARLPVWEQLCQLQFCFSFLLYRSFGMPVPVSEEFTYVEKSQRLPVCLFSTYVNSTYN